MAGAGCLDLKGFGNLQGLMAVQAPQVTVEEPRVIVGTPQVTVETPQVIVGTSQVTLQTPRVIVGTPQVTVQTPRVIVGTPQVTVQTPRVIVERGKAYRQAVLAAKAIPALAEILAMTKSTTQLCPAQFPPP